MSQDPMKKEITGVSQEEFDSLVRMANDGDQVALDHLRRILNENPHIWLHVGDLATHAEMTLVKTIAKGDTLLAESITRRIAQMKEDLGGPTPSPLEELAVQRIVMCWLECQWADTCFPEPAKEDLPMAKFALKMKESAMTRFTRAMKAMELARRLLPSTVAVPVVAYPGNGHAESNGHHKTASDKGHRGNGKKKRKSAAKTDPFTNRVKDYMPEPANGTGPNS